MSNTAKQAPLLFAVFAASLFISAFLVFFIELSAAKQVLPLLGGTPAVWNTCIVFFQTLLMAGYAYAHWSTQRLGIRRSMRLHLVLLVVSPAAFLLPPLTGWLSPSSTHPIVWLFGFLFLAVGIPFFFLSSNAPLLQRWFSCTDTKYADDPYFLYAASNAGSLLGLLSFPFWVEPHLGLASQRLAWKAGYGVFVFLVLVCAALTKNTKSDVSVAGVSAQSETAGVAWKQQLRWIFCAAVPSSLLLGVTTFFTTDIASVPLFWVIPLAIYLLTFILAFSPLMPVLHKTAPRFLTMILLFASFFILCNATQPLTLVLPVHMLLFFAAALFCHGELARLRPGKDQLTVFYLCLSLGGVLGGMFNTLAAPVLFNRPLEYPLALTLVCFLRPWPEKADRRINKMDFLLPLAVLFMIVNFASAVRPIDIAQKYKVVLVFAVPALLVTWFLHRPVRFALGMASILLFGTWIGVTREDALLRARSFFGIFRVMKDPEGYVDLFHGTTLHGKQSLDPVRKREPLTYFHPTGPVGQVFDQFISDEPILKNVAVIGLGTGSLSCYATPGQSWTYYEIDPLVHRIARSGRYFTFLRDCLESYNLVLGDARLTLSQAPDQKYQLLVVDAFSSDAIPVHLITREAMAIYLKKIAPGGLIAFHISNRFFNLEPVLTGLARDAGIVAAARHDGHDPAVAQAPGKTPSHWVILAKNEADLRGIGTDKRWKRLDKKTTRLRLWTDDFSDVLSLLRWH